MKKKIRNIVFIIIGLILLHDNGLLPFHLQWYNMTLKQYGTFCEIQDGALAGNEDIQYRFLLTNGDSIVYGKGMRIIELREKEGMSLGVGGYLPIFKNCDPKVEFECYDVKNNKSLGVVGAKYKCTVNGFLNRPDFKEYIYSYYIQEIYSKLIMKEKFIDDLVYQKGVVSTDFWSAHHSSWLNLTRTGETIVPSRKINLRKGIVYSKDSIPFSTHLGDSSEYNHETLIVDKEKKEVILKRYSNNGKLVIEAIFEDSRRREKSLFTKVKDDWRKSGGLSLLKYRRSNEDEFTLIK